jgi:exosortase
MSTAELSNPNRSGAAATTPQPAPLISRDAWVRIGVVGLLFVLLFNDFLYRAFGFSFDGGFHFRGYVSDGNWSHALVVPLISLYFLYQHREELRRTPVRTGWLGLIPLILGIVFYALAIGPTAFGADEAGREAAMSLRAFGNDTAKGYAMILALAGVVWLMAGGRMLRLCWFPIAYLVFAVKISDRIWESIAFKLQGIAAAASGVAINVLGLPLDLTADVAGNTIDIFQGVNKVGEGLNVAEACSGLRMLMTFIALGVAVAYLAERPWWARVIMVLLTVPIAILVNVGRVTALGLLYPYNKDLATGDFHLFIGMLMLLPALALFMLVGWVLNQLFVPEPQPRRQPQPPADDRSTPGNGGKDT